MSGPRISKLMEELREYEESLTAEGLKCFRKAYEGARRFSGVRDSLERAKKACPRDKEPDFWRVSRQIARRKNRKHWSDTDKD